MNFSCVGSDEERFFHAMLQLSNSPILITDARAPDYPIVRVNPAFERATGYSAEEVIGRNCRFLQNDDRHQPGCFLLAEAVRKGEPCEALLRNYRKDGQLVWTRVYMFPVTDAHGEITHFVGIQHDVTVETARTRALQEKQAFIDTSPDVYVKIDRELNIAQIDGACETVLGWRAADLIGRSATLIVPPERMSEATARLQWLFTQNQPHRYDAEYSTRAGVRVTIEWSAIATSDGHHILAVGRDTTARRTAERAAERANARIASILSSITEACFSLDRNWCFTYMNTKASEWLAKQNEDLIGRNIWEAFPDAVGSPFHETYERGMRTQQFAQCEAYYAPVGRWLEARAYPSEEGLTVFFLDISVRKQHELALMHSSTHDALTGLPNRSACLDTLTERLRAALSTGEDVAAVFIDLDRFKEINDTFGHAAGDTVLKQIGQRLRCFSCGTCYPARISGDEFVVVVTGSDERHVKSLALQLLDSVAAPIELQGREVTIGASIGIALASDDATTADDLINQADTAMYVSKSKGRHAVTIFNREVDKWNLRRHRLRQDMLHALQNGQFVLHYQPQVSLHDGSVVGAEALVRWQHPEFGLLSPAAFIEIAEESPLIIDLGAWAFNEACLQLHAWQERGHSLKISVNVSARQLASRDMPEMMSQTISRHDVAANCIKLEVTESMLAQDVDATSQVLAGLKQKGFRIALDDFGTGYSNLSYISRLPVTAIKIDRSFVTGLTADEAALPLIKGIVALAKSLDLTVICEGIETAEQLALLQTTDCDSIQGYLISRPLPADAFFSAFLQRHP
jgi:diguanylate cyclase (GGDEF)-like protein/PAS domain S-box-containing protein